MRLKLEFLNYFEQLLRLTLCVQVNSQILEDVHVAGVSYGCGTGAHTLSLNSGYSLCSNIKHQRVDQRNIVPVTWIIGNLKIKTDMVNSVFLIQIYG